MENKGVYYTYISLPPKRPTQIVLGGSHTCHKVPFLFTDSIFELDHLRSSDDFILSPMII